MADERVEFIKGDPSQDESLIRAGIERADNVIVLSDCTKGANDADAEALMVVLAVESLNRKVHTCVQFMNSSSRVHLEHAHADEIICRPDGRQPPCCFSPESRCCLPGDEFTEL